MKQFFLVIISVCTFCGKIHAQYTQDRYHIKDSLLKYQVSSYSIFTFENNGKDSLLAEELYFDRKGNLIREVNPRYRDTTTYTYDSLQREITRHSHCPGIINETVYSYYGPDGLSKTVRKDTTGFINQTRIYHYQDGRLVHEHIVSNYKTRGTTNKSDVYYHYDSTGLHVTELFPDSTHRTEITQNEYGGIIYFELIQSTNHSPPPVWFGYTKNLRTEEYRFFNQRKIVAKKMIYDERGMIQEIQSCGDQNSEHPCFVTHTFFYHYFDE